MITIYTDGSSKGNPGPGGYAAVISYKLKVKSKEEDWITEIGGRAEHTTNNRMELVAVIEALKFVNGLTPPLTLPLDQGEGEKGRGVSVFTDSKYVKQGITEWIHNWQKKNWKTAGKKPVQNKDLWQELLSVVEDKNLEWKYVEGHAGHKLNERADEIATSFADNIKPILYNGSRQKYK